MTKSVRNLVTSGSVLALSLAIASPAFAQQVAPPAPPPTDSTTTSSETRPATAGDRAAEEGSTPLETVTTANPAAAAEAGAPNETIVVTGTRIRGVAPVGSNLISVGRDTIEDTSVQTVQQLLKTVPAVVGLGSAGQGSFGSADASGTNAPTIHGLGASASNSTLVLIDGHRFPLSGVNHTLGDPNIIPPNALERVEVLPDGASSVYGSDAVAGVINFITRRNFKGVEATGQLGFADGYRTRQAGLVAGTTWDSGWLMGAFNYSYRSNLAGSDRSFLFANHIDEAAAAGIDVSSATAQGRANRNNFFCDPATVQIGNNIYLYNPGTGTYSSSVANSQANAVCDTTGYADQIPEEKRYSMMVKAEQEIGDRLTVGVDLVYSKRDNFSNVSRSNGGVTATVYGPGSKPPGGAGQINPFFQPIPGSTATSYTVRFSGDELLGPGAYNKSGEETKYAYLHGEYKLSEAWRISSGFVIGNSDSRSDDVGRLCTSCALLALNGTTNQTGNPATESVPGTGLYITQLPLTTANALDVFNLGSANRTSAAVLARLTDSTASQTARQNFREFRVDLNGDLVQLPGGTLKLAVGGEMLHYTLAQDISRPLGVGPATLYSRLISLDYKRNVKSAYGELYIPIVSPDMNIPAIRSLEVDLAGRYDDYSDFGSTKNPKVGVTWEVFRGLRARGSWAKSFVAPALTSYGTNGNGTTAESNIAAGPTNLVVPRAAYPGVETIPGIVCDATFCTLGTNNVRGLQINGGNNGLQPQKGKSWSLGADYSPEFIRGLRLSATYWHNQIIGGITAPSSVTAVNVAGLQNLLQLYPAGATPAQLAAIIGDRPLNTTLPGTVYFTYDFRQRNVLNLTAEGVDAEARYHHTTPWGNFDLGTGFSLKTKFDQNFGGGTTFSVLNTTGFNTTFPSIKFELRADAGVKYGNLSGRIFMNHTGAYKNWSGAAIDPVVSVGGVPTGDGGDKVKAFNTFDAHIAYDIPSNSILGKSQVYLDVTNIFDKKPPFYNGNTGYDTFSGNPLMRVISVGLRAKW